MSTSVTPFAAGGRAAARGKGPAAPNRPASLGLCRAQASGEGSSTQISQVRLTTAKDCSLGISIWPDFSYNASGGGAVGTAVDDGSGTVAVEFDPESVNIPPIDMASARIAGVLPMPPGLKISIEPKSLAGEVDRATGEARLEFDAEFIFTVGSLYRAPPLSVVTRLTTGTSEGVMRNGEGSALDSSGRCKLAGVASVPKIPTDGNPIMDTIVSRFLMLPTDALAVLSGTIEFE